MTNLTDGEAAISRGRWLLKKSARKTLALAASAVGALHKSERPEVHVLTYHRFGDSARDPFCVRPTDFDRQMALLAEHDLAVSLAEVESFVERGTPLRPGAVLVTVDDGCPSFAYDALPILQRHRIPAVLFVPAGELSEGTLRGDARREQPEDRMTWRELNDVAQAGIAIGSHAWTHESLGSKSLDAVREQVSRSRETLEQRLGRRITAFAYPFGTRADYSPAIADVLQQEGYACAFTSQHGAICRDDDPFALPRVKIEGGEDLWMFQAAIRGALDAWRWIDKTMWKLQAAGSTR